MTRYKITKIYIVEATSRIEARNVFTSAQAQNTEDEFLEYVSIQHVAEKKNGWANSLKEQLTGHTSTKR